MKSTRKYLEMLLSLAMVTMLLLSSTIFVFADEILPDEGKESTPAEEVSFLPNVTKITVSPKEVKPGDYVTVTIEVDEPDEYKAAHIDFMGKEGNHYSIDYKNGRLSGKFAINDAFKNGEYNAISMQIENTDYTTKDISDELSSFDASFTVTGSGEDKEPPTGEGSVDGDTFKPGDTIKVTANVKDNRKMGHVSALAYPIVNPDADTEDFWAKYDESDEHFIAMIPAGDGDDADGGQYEGSEVVINSWRNGDYDIIIEAYDALGNYSILETIRISINESQEDRQAPVIGSATLDRNEAKPGDIVRVRINDVKDLEGADVEDVYAYLAIDTDDGIIGYSFSLEPVEGMEASYEGEIEVDDGFQNVEYVLEVDTLDSMENFYEHFFEDQTVKVHGSREDVNPPKLTSLTFDKSEYLPGESPIMTVTGSDDTEIGEILAFIENEKGVDFAATYGFDDSDAEIESNKDGSFIARIKLKNDLEVGTYRINFVIGRDVFGNEVIYDDEIFKFEPLGDLAQSFRVIEKSDTPSDTPIDKPSDKPSEGAISNGNYTNSGSTTDSSNQSVDGTAKSNSKSSDTSKATTGVPKTGDAENLILWIVIINALAITTIAMRKGDL